MNRQSLTFKISPVFPIKEELAKDTFRFCLNVVKAIKYRTGNGLTLPKKMTIKMEKGAWWRTRSGHATRNFKGNPHANIYLCCSPDCKPHWDVYHRYANCPDVPFDWISDNLEMFVHLIGHELGHAIMGFEGDKIGEYQCERLASEVLSKWKEYHRPAALLI